MVQKNITELGPKEAEFLSIVSEENPQFTIAQAIAYWKTPGKAWKKVHLLEKRGWIARIERGKYLVIPLEAGARRNWSEDTYIIATTLIKPAAIAYWSAIRHWNWTEQIPRVVMVQTTSRKKLSKRTVFGVQYHFVKVPESKFFGHIKEWRNGRQILITDREKTLLDCADDVERAGGIEELSKAVKAACREISWATLDEYVHRFPNRSAMKRLGFLMETQKTYLPGEAIKYINVWQSELSAGIVPLQPGIKKRGKIVTRWRLQLNAEVE